MASLGPPEIQSPRSPEADPGPSPSSGGRDSVAEADVLTAAAGTGHPGKPTGSLWHGRPETAQPTARRIRY